MDGLATDCADPKAFAMSITYDSMAPNLERGDCVILMPSVKPRHGDLVGAKHRVHGEMVRIYNMEPDGKIRLSAYNPAWKDLLDTRDSFEWICPVHSSVRNYRKDSENES